MIVRLDHVGLAADDAVGVGRLLDALGLAKIDSGVADAYGVSCDFWQLDGDGATAVEVVSPLSENSTIAGHLARRGQGLYHLAFEVDDLEGELRRLRGKGFLPVDAEPCAGARRGMQVAFTYLPPPAELLVELVHYAEPG